jgi:hypothetical protein
MHPLSTSSASKTVTHASLSEDLVVDPDAPIRMVRAGSAGNIKFGYQDGSEDVHPVLAGEHVPVIPAKIFQDGTTALPITVYY